MVILRETSDRKIKYRFLVFGIMLVILLAIISGAPVFAAQCGGADTALVECGNDEGGIWHILSLILDIMSIGIGILGVIGIMVAGIQYLTAGDKEDQAKKAKSRIYEIVLGLVVYAVLFVALEWLMPGGFISSESELAKTGTTEQIEEMEKKRQEEANKASNSNKNSSDKSSKDLTNKEIRQLINKTAKRFARNHKAYKKAVKAVKIGKTKGDGTNKCFKAGRACSAYVATVIRTVIPEARGKNGWPAMSHKDTEYIKKHPKLWKSVSASNVKPGDIGIKSVVNDGHIAIVVKTKNGLRLAEADYKACKNGGSGGWPKVSGDTPKSRTSLKYYRYIGGK